MSKQIFFLLILIFNNLFSIDSGQFFILTLPNTDSHQELGVWLSKTKPAGVMLLTQHVTNREKIKILTNFLQNKAKKLNIPKLVIAVDWEGGVVSRPGEPGGFVSVPAPKNLGEVDRTYSFLTGKLIGQQMRSCGINMNFAPSLDLFDPNNFILGSRTFSNNPEKVYECAAAFASGLESEGIIPVFKHFPGLGLGGLDTHLHQVEINSTKQEFEKHVSPFVSIIENSKEPFIMATHAKLPTIFENLPSSISPKVANWIKEKNKNSVLVTDDFFMKGVQVKEDTFELALDSLLAGFDFIIYSAQNKGDEIRLVESLNRRIDSISEKEQAVLENKLSKVKAIKERKFLNLDDDLLTLNVSSELSEKKLSKYLASKTIKEFYENLDLNNALLLTVDISKIRPGQEWFTKNNSSYLAKKLKKSGVNIKELIFNAKDTNSVDLVLNFVKENKDKYKTIVLSTFFYAQGVWDTVQIEILEKLKSEETFNIEENLNLIILSMGHPYEQNIIKDSKIFNLGSFLKPNLREVTKRLTKNYLPEQDLILNQFKKKIKNKNFGLLCHNASWLDINSKKHFLPDLLLNFAKNQKNKTRLAALFSPEHGLKGNFGACAHVNSQNISPWGCPVYSLHGQNKKPTKDMLSGLDLLVVDLHEVGIRAYTYLSTLKLVLDSAAKNNLPVVVVNSPNPIYFWPPQGPELVKEQESFVGMVYTPFIHGSTIGDIAKNINKDINANLSIINLYNKKNFKNYYKSGKYLSASPNLANLEAVYSYPVTVFLEGTNYSEGRGTTFPFQQIGAPWVDGQKLASILNSKKFEGVYFEPVQFKPVSMQGKSIFPKHKNEICQGVFLHFSDIKKAEVAKISPVILNTLFDLYPKESKLISFGKIYLLDHLVGNESWRRVLEKKIKS